MEECYLKPRTSILENRSIHVPISDQSHRSVLHPHSACHKREIKLSEKECFIPSTSSMIAPRGVSLYDITKNEMGVNLLTSTSPSNMMGMGCMSYSDPSVLISPPYSHHHLLLLDSLSPNNKQNVNKLLTKPMLTNC